MARTFIQQDTQIINSTVYDDTLTMSSAETATNLEQDLNYLRTQVKTLLGKTDWFTAPSDNFSLTAVHDKRLLYWIQKTDDVEILAGENWVLLTGATKPSHDIAIGATALGAIVAQLATVVDANDLTVAANNGNVMRICDAATNQPILTSGGYEIYGLLQVGVDATDGNAFGDTSSDDQGQISFVYFNPSTEAITAAPVADIAGKTIKYAYKVRTDLYNLPEGAYDQSITFVDSSIVTPSSHTMLSDRDIANQHPATAISITTPTGNLLGSTDLQVAMTTVDGMNALRAIDKNISYDGNGRVSVVTDVRGTKTMGYDGGGKLISITGTGIYQSKTLSYTGDNLTSVTVI